MNTTDTQIIARDLEVGTTFDRHVAMAGRMVETVTAITPLGGKLVIETTTGGRRHLWPHERIAWGRIL